MKLVDNSAFSVWKQFELCPYGIWNNSMSDAIADAQKFELCPYGIWNEEYKTDDKSYEFNLNFVPMGFETVNEILT